MRLYNTLSGAISLTATLLRTCHAGLIPDLVENLENLQDVNKRCENPCGYYNQVCCNQGDVCYTDANGQAQCGAGNSGGQWQYYVTTYVQTDLRTVTETYSSYVGGVTQAPTSGCAYSVGESQCGSTCCKSGYYCQQANMCVQVPGGSSGYYSGLLTVTTYITDTATPPLRPTSVYATTVIAGTTVAFQTPVGTDGAVLTGPSASTSGGGLSGGAIAGIVIGVLAAIFILLLICACCCFKGLLDGLLALFGLGPRRRRRTEETYVEERHSRHGRVGGRTWFGMRPGKSEVVEEKKQSGWGTAGGLAAFLGGLALILGLKRKHDKRDDKTSSSYSYYDSDYYTSSSSSSSGRRTRTNRSRSRSRASRGTRL